MQTSLHLLLGVTILSWAELSSAEPGLADLVSNTVNALGGSSPTPTPATKPEEDCGSCSQPDPKPAPKPDSDKIEKVVKDGVDLGLSYIPGTSTWANGDARSEPCTNTVPLTFNVSKYETFKMCLMENSIVVKPADSGIITKGTLYGGILGIKVYIFYAIYFEINKNGGTFVLKATVVFYLAEHSSMDEACRHPDGVVIVEIFITIGSPKDYNPMMEKFGDKLKEIKKRGDCVTLQSTYTYAFMKTQPADAPYTYWEGPWYDAVTKLTYRNVITIRLSTQEKDNCMSDGQFHETFDHLMHTRMLEVAIAANVQLSTSQKTCLGVTVRTN